MEGIRLNKKILIAIIIIVAVSIAGTAVYYALLAQDTSAKGTLVVQVGDFYGSGVSGVTVTILGPEQSPKTGVTDQNGKVTFTELSEGTYEGIVTKDGYFTIFISANVKNGRTTTNPASINEDRNEYTLLISTNKDATSIQQGNTGTIEVTVASTGDFAGALSLSCTQLPSGVTATFQPASVALTAGGEASSTLTLTVSATAQKGIYPIGIAASDQYSPLNTSHLMLQVS